jgi:hypothetical protein
MRTETVKTVKKGHCQGTMHAYNMFSSPHNRDDLKRCPHRTAAVPSTVSDMNSS